MPSPQETEIEQSLTNLQHHKPIFQQDFFNIAWGFVFHPNQDQYLLQTNRDNSKLAETLLIFRKKLNEIKVDESDLKASIHQAYLHYIVNTTGAIPEEDGLDSFDVFKEATEYANFYNVEVKERDGRSILISNNKEVECPNWGTEAGWSAPWSLRQVGPVINKVRYGREDVIPSNAFSFDEDATGYTLQNAMILADCAHLVYSEPTYVKAQLIKWGYTDFHWIEDTETDTDTQVCVAKRDNHLLVCFRGTSSGTDIKIDFKFFRTDAFEGDGGIHRGFNRALNSVWQKVENVIDHLGKDKKVFLCGHSLGAALATLMAHRLAFDNYTVAGVYVYGSPRIGNWKYRTTYNERLKSKTYLHINNKDIVPKAPPQIIGYYHVGETPRIFDRGHTIDRPSNFEEPTTDHIKEVDFDSLSAEEQEAIKEQTRAVENSIAASTLFLRTPPNLLQAGSYSSQFETGFKDDHSMDQYLFKIGCAIVDGEWGRIEQST